MTSLTFSKKKLFYFSISLLILTSCKIGKDSDSDTQILPEARVLMGVAQNYKPSNQPPQESDLKYIDVRRQLGWRIVEDIVRNVTIAPNPDLPVNMNKMEMPLWQSWYDSEEFQKLFQDLYNQHGKENRLANKPLCPKFYNNAFLAYHMFEDRKMKRNFNAARLAKYKEEILANFSTMEDIKGIPGAGKTLFSPSYIRHLLKTYQSLYLCDHNRRITPMDDTFKAQLAEQSNYIPQQTTRAVCFDHEFPTGFEDVKLKADRFTHCQENEPKFTTPGLEQAVATLPNPLTKDTDWGPAVTMKVTFAHNNDKINTYKTDQIAFDTMLAKNADWRDAIDQELVASSIPTEKIYTINTNDPVAGRDTFKLTGMHITSKEFKEWVWITLWWSDTPDQDFGQDRPTSLQNTPWANYKMCITTAFDEPRDANGNLFFKDEKYSEKYRDLTKALYASDDLAKPYSWCSNPYIEFHPGNANTNCIGCHQHGGDHEASATTIFSDPKNPGNGLLSDPRYPHNGRSQVRQDFPSDYTWSIMKSPDNFYDRIKSVIDTQRTRDLQ